jgi:hypothetical protein
VRDLTEAQRVANEVLGNKARGDVGAHGFWKRGRTTIFDIEVCNTDPKSYRNRKLKKFWRAQHKGRRISMRRRVSSGIVTSP